MQNMLMQQLLNQSSTEGKSNRLNGGSKNGHSDGNLSGDWLNEQQSISNNTPTMLLRCAECGLAKNSSEELEVHIKQEHLQWLPFQCPICLNERASDAQMREHLYSAHKKNMNKFIYVDNVMAKRNLQVLMDRSFTHAMNTTTNSNATSNKRGPLGALNGRSNGAMLNTLANQLMAQHSKEQKDNKEVVSINLNGTGDSNSSIRSQSPRSMQMSRKREHDSSISGSSNTDALLAQINMATGAISNDEDYEEPQDALAMMFSSKRVKNEGHEDDDLRLSSLPDEDFGTDPSSVLESLFANVSAAAGGGMEGLVSDEFHLNSKFGGKHSPMMTKKRVLGECSKCQKPVTAGARQMHMFYHLGKDHGIFRFRCKFDNCNIEHYRKDQMENHHSKVHGRIDPDMMEDRSLELYQRCQDLSMDLIGTNNCTPGPTAARAAIAYEAQMAEQRKKGSEKISRRKEGHDSTWQNKAIPEDEHPLECRKCHKTMQNRIRGFHILWHLAKDLGINRYTCKYCPFGHDRSQSVQTHGKREHGTDDVVEDRIDEYEPEIKQMSQACFGFQALFSQESRRRSKIPLAPRETAEDNSGSASGEDEPTDEDKEEETESGIIEEEEGEEEMAPVKPSSSSKPIRRHISHRRFGTRKAPNKTKRQEMAKLREISMRLGGAQYFKKKVNEAAHCEICGMLQHSRLSEHAYKHLNMPLFVCPHCDLGNYSRETVVKHVKEMHEGVSSTHPIDQRLKFAQEIKNMIGKCYPSFFVDAPIPTANDIEKLKSQLGDGMKHAIAADTDESEGDEEVESIENDDEAGDEAI